MEEMSALQLQVLQLYAAHPGNWPRIELELGPKLENPKMEFSRLWQRYRPTQAECTAQDVNDFVDWGISKRQSTLLGLIEKDTVQIKNLQAEITQLELEWVEQERLAALKVEAENAMEVEPTPLVEALSSTENLILTQNEVLKPVEAKQTPLPKQKIEQKNIQESAAGKNEETVTEMMIDVGQNKEIADIKSAIRLFKKTALNIWNDIAQHKHAAIFMHPVKEEEAPGYHSLILRPMDLNTIKVRIRDGSISNILELKRDLLLMFQNAVMYNGESHTITEFAKELRVFSMEQFALFTNDGMHLKRRSSFV